MKAQKQNCESSTRCIYHYYWQCYQIIDKTEIGFECATAYQVGIYIYIYIPSSGSARRSSGTFSLSLSFSIKKHNKVIFMYVWMLLISIYRPTKTHETRMKSCRFYSFWLIIITRTIFLILFHPSQHWDYKTNVCILLFGLI